jgi:uncharacterized membrane protein (UPF0127 family)
MLSAEKKNRLKAIAILVLMGAALVVAAAAMYQERGQAEVRSGLRTDELTIETAEGKKRRFDIEIAQTPVDMEVGLMFRKELAPDAGMLFLLGAPRVISFWMKNTLIPLDMLFIAPDGKILTIRRNAEPLSLAPVSSVYPVSAVLEINGGAADAAGIAVGDYVRHAYFKRTAAGAY